MGGGVGLGGDALAGALGGRPEGDGRRRRKGKSEVGEEAG